MIHQQIEKKKCLLCGKTKFVEEFYQIKYKSVKGFKRYRSYCKKCYLKYNRQRLYNMTPEQQERERQRNHKNMKKRNDKLMKENPEKLRADRRKAFRKWYRKNKKLHNKRNLECWKKRSKNLKGKSRSS